MTDSDNELSPDRPADTGGVESHQPAEAQHPSESQQRTQPGSERQSRADDGVDPQPAPKEKESFVKSYLRKVGKAMIVFAIIGCCFLMFAAWLLISTFDRMISAAN